MPEKKVRVNWFIGGLLIVFALLCDAFQAVLAFFNIIPALGNALAFVGAWFIAIFAYIVFFITFMLLGVHYFSGKKIGMKIGSMIGSLITEFIPLMNIMPGITMGVVGTIIASRVEDEETYQEALKKAKAQQQALAARIKNTQAYTQGALAQQAYEAQTQQILAEQVQEEEELGGGERSPNRKKFGSLEEITPPDADQQIRNEEERLKRGIAPTTEASQGS